MRLAGHSPGSVWHPSWGSQGLHLVSHTVSISPETALGLTACPDSQLPDLDPPEATWGGHRECRGAVSRPWHWLPGATGGEKLSEQNQEAEWKEDAPFLLESSHDKYKRTQWGKSGTREGVPQSRLHR